MSTLLTHFALLDYGDDEDYWPCLSCGESPMYRHGFCSTCWYEPGNA